MSINERVSSAVKKTVKSKLGRKFPDTFGVRRHQKILNRFEVNENLLTRDGAVPVFWWTDAPNFGGSS